MAMVDLNIYIYTHMDMVDLNSNQLQVLHPLARHQVGGTSEVVCAEDCPGLRLIHFLVGNQLFADLFFYSGVLTMFNVMLMCLLFLISSTIIIDSLDEISGENNEFPSVSGNHHLKGPLGQNVPGTDSRFHFHRFQPPKHAEKYFQDNRSMMFSPESPGFQLFDLWGCQNVVMTSGLEGPRCTLHLDVS